LSNKKKLFADNWTKTNGIKEGKRLIIVLFNFCRFFGQKKENTKKLTLALLFDTIFFLTAKNTRKENATVLGLFVKLLHH